MFEITPRQEPYGSLLERRGMHMRTLRVRLSLRVIQSYLPKGLVITWLAPFFIAFSISISWTGFDMGGGRYIGVYNLNGKVCLACVSLTPHLGGVSAGIKVPEIQGKDNPCCLPPNKGGQVAKKSSPAPVKAQTGANRPNGKAWKKYIWTVVFNERRNRHKMIRIPNPRLKAGS